MARIELAVLADEGLVGRQLAQAYGAFQVSSAREAGVTLYGHVH